MRVHAWAVFGPWYGGWAMNRVCKRCGKHEGRYRARGDSAVLWHHVADDVDWQTFSTMPVGGVSPDAEGRECRGCGQKQVMRVLANRRELIDACIADIVDALNAGGVATTDSCCGHGDNAGGIALVDGRWLVVTDRAHALRWCGEPDDTCEDATCNWSESEPGVWYSGCGDVMYHSPYQTWTHCPHCGSRIQRMSYPLDGDALPWGDQVRSRAESALEVGG